MDKKFEIVIKSIKGKKEVVFPEGFPNTIPKDLHEDDVYTVIKKKVSEDSGDAEVTISREDIHKVVEEEYGDEKTAKWGDHSHGTNSAGNHSHN